MKFSKKTLFRIINSAGDNKTNNKFWNFVEKSDEEVELSLYGELVSQKSWWNEEGEITATEFKEQLDQYKDKSKITLRVNSNGGDVFTGSAIYSLLKDCKAEITAKIDGMCMSAVTIPVMAADKILISAPGIFMIHDPLVGVCGYYNASELGKMINKLEVVKESIISTYVSRTGKTKDELKDLMTNELWLTGEDAVKEGFCDEVMYSQEEEESPVLNEDMLIFNSVSVDLSKHNISNEFKNKIKSFKKSPSVKNIKKDSFFNVNKNKGEEEMIKNVEELKASYPDIYNQVVNVAKEEERNRIKDIDDLGAVGYEELVNKAKYEEFKDSGEVAKEMIKVQKAQGQEYLNKRKEDIKNSNTDAVPGITAEITNSVEDEINSVFSKVKNTIQGGIK